MSSKSSLREYQNDLQAQMEQARLAGAQEALLYVGFVSHGRRFLLDARYVVEAADASALVALPNAKPWATGIANIKGDAYAITDFAVFTGGATPPRGKFLTLDDDLMPRAALHVERLTGLFDPESLKEKLPRSESFFAPWIASASIIADETYYMISGEMLAADPKFSNLQSGEHHDEPQG